MAYTTPLLAPYFASILVQGVRKDCAAMCRVVCKGFDIVAVMVSLGVALLFVVAIPVVIAIWGNKVGLVLV